MKTLSEAHKNAISRGMQNHVVSEEHRKNTSEAVREYYRRNPVSFETRKKHSANAVRSWRGGEDGDVFASILCPLGYVRELQVRHAGRQYNLDFAHPEVKVNIELDGLYHMSTPEEDTQRDATLKDLGWKIIRIKQ